MLRTDRINDDGVRIGTGDGEKFLRESSFTCSEVVHTHGEEPCVMGDC